MPVRLVPRGQEGSDDLSATTTAAERLAMMRPLALAAWSVAGLPLPTYRRDEMPIKLVRRR
jgi:hypothetical protein